MSAANKDILSGLDMGGKHSGGFYGSKGKADDGASDGQAGPAADFGPPMAGLSPQVLLAWHFGAGSLPEVRHGRSDSILWRRRSNGAGGLRFQQVLHSGMAG